MFSRKMPPEMVMLPLLTIAVPVFFSASTSLIFSLPYIPQPAAPSGFVISEGAARNFYCGSTFQINRAAPFIYRVAVKGATLHDEDGVVIEIERTAIASGILALPRLRNIAGNGTAEQRNLVFLRRKVESAAKGIARAAQTGSIIRNGDVVQLHLECPNRVQCAAVRRGLVPGQGGSVKIQRGRGVKVQRAGIGLAVLNRSTPEACGCRADKIRRAAVFRGGVAVPDHVGKYCPGRIPAVQAAAVLRRLIVPEGNAAEGHRLRQIHKAAEIQAAAVFRLVVFQRQAAQIPAVSIQAVGRDAAAVGCLVSGNHRAALNPQLLRVVDEDAAAGFRCTVVLHRAAVKLQRAAASSSEIACLTAFSIVRPPNPYPNLGVGSSTRKHRPGLSQAVPRFQPYPESTLTQFISFYNTFFGRNMQVKSTFSFTFLKYYHKSKKYLPFCKSETFSLLPAGC